MDPKATKSYEAFRVQPIIETFPGHQRFESLCCWNGHLLVGLQDGTIVQFASQQGEGPWQVMRRHRSLERKAVVQMAAVQLGKRPLLLTLTEDGVNLLTLPDMKLKFQPMGSRGASLFAWSEEDQTLAVAVRRKIILYHLHGSDLLDAGERTAPDVVLAMVWVAAGVLLLGMRRQYGLLNTNTGVVTDAGSPGGAPHPLGVLCPGGQEMLLARDSSTYYHSVLDGRYSRRRPLLWSEPLLALVTAGQQAVAVTASGLEVRSLRRVAEGHVVQRVRVPEPPRHVPPAVSEDGSVFVVTAVPPPPPSPPSAAATLAATAAAASGGAILRLVPVPLEEQAHTLAQMGEYGEALALAALIDDEEAGTAANATAAGGTARELGGEAAPVAAAAEVTVRFEPADGAASGGAGRSPGAGVGPGSSRRELLQQRLRLAYGHYLFQEGEYDEGMAQLALCSSTTALVLLRLFPSLVPPKFKSYLPTHAAGQPLPAVSEPSGEAHVTAVSQLLPYVLSHRTRAMNALADNEVASRRGDQGKEEEEEVAKEHGPAAAVAGRQPTAENGGIAANGTSTAECAAARGKETTAGAPSAPPSASSSSGAAAAAAGAVGKDSQPHAASGGPAPAPAAGGDGRDGGGGGGDGSSCGGAGHRDAAAAAVDVGTLSFPPPPPPRELLVILDTAIVRIMVAMPDTGSLLRFVQLPNYVDLHEGEKALEESGMYAELAALYKCNGCHDKGLELLRQLSQDPGSLPSPARGAAADLPGLPGVWAAVRYVVALSAADAAAIQRHAGWILAADAEAGLSALLNMRPPLHPSLALSILNQHSAHYCGLYLETALQIGVALPQDYHNELLLIYLRDILSKEPLSPSRAKSHSGDELKEALLSHRLDADQPPVLFPEDLAHALLKPGGTAAAAAAARRFASAPASSAGTPGAMSRAGSRCSVQSGRGDGGDGSAKNGRRASAASTEGTGASSGSDEEEAGGVGEVSSEAAEAQRPANGSGSGAAVAAVGKPPPGPRSRTPPPPSGVDDGVRATEPSAAEPPTAKASGSGAALPPRPQGHSVTMAPDMERPRRPRQTRRSSAGALSSLAGGKPPVPHSPVVAPASPSGAGAAGSASAAAAGPSLYQRLRDLVYTSPYIDPGYVLDKLPLGELLEIRALMLERLGNHREALRLYVHALKDLAAAEAYCDRVYAAAAATVAPQQQLRCPHRGLGGLDVGVLGDLAHPGDIYLELVQALYDGPESCPSARALAAAAGGGGGGSGPAETWLVPSPSMSGEAAEGRGPQLEPATWHALSRVLSRKRERMDPMQVLAMLPDSVAVADVLPWLEGVLRHTLEARRNLAVMRQLRRIENLTALGEAVRMRQQRIVVTLERACSLCHKRLGGAAFVSYPGGLLAHYSCHMRHTGVGVGGWEPAGVGGGAAATAAVGGSSGFTTGGEVGGYVVEVQLGAGRVIRGLSAGGAELEAWA